MVALLESTRMMCPRRSSVRPGRTGAGSGAALRVVGFAEMHKLWAAPK